MALVRREGERGRNVGVTPAPLSFAPCPQPLLISLQAMLFGVWALLLLASLTPVCVYVWKRFFTKAVSPCINVVGAVACSDEASMLREEGDSLCGSQEESSLSIPSYKVPVSNQCPYPKTPRSHRRPHLSRLVELFAVGPRQLRLALAGSRTS